MSIPNAAAALSTTRTPSGNTSVPIPSPAIAAILCVLMSSLVVNSLSLNT
jgi:hypothetical protein